MSIHSQAIEPVPAETARIARLAFPKGNRDLTLCNEIGTLYTDQDFTSLVSSYGQTAIALDSQDDHLWFRSLRLRDHRLSPNRAIALHLLPFFP